MVAAAAGLSLTHMAMAFAVAHPAVISAIIGQRTMQHFDDLLAGAEVSLSDEVLDQIAAIVPPGTESAPIDAEYKPPALRQAELRRRPGKARAAA